MGQGQSHSEGSPASEFARIEGFQIVRLLPESPAHQAGLVPYFDFILALDDLPLSHSSESPLLVFKTHLAERQGRPVSLRVFNLRLRQTRQVSILPTTEWTGGGLLGCSIQWNQVGAALRQTWHITDILEGSPASSCAALQADRVYLLGMQDTPAQVVALFKDPDNLKEWLARWASFAREVAEGRAPGTPAPQHSLLLLIYDIVENAVKEVVVGMGTGYDTPVGFSVSGGLLHLIPPAVDPAGTGLPRMNHFFVPEDLAFETDYPPPTSSASGTHRGKDTAEPVKEERAAGAVSPYPGLAVPAAEAPVQGRSPDPEAHHPPSASPVSQSTEEPLVKAEGNFSGPFQNREEPRKPGVVGGAGGGRGVAAPRPASFAGEGYFESRPPASDAVSGMPAPLEFPVMLPPRART